MNAMVANYLFQLSPLELNWLAGAFGITRLPLIDDPLRHIANSQLAEEAKVGLASLQSRGLIQRASGGYQVDRLPAAIVKWLGSSAGMLILDVHTRHGISRHAQVFTEEDASMSVSLEEGNYQFLFLPGHRAVSEYVFNQAGASFADQKGASAQYALSQPVTILRTVWTDPSLAGKMLKVIGLKPKETKPLLAWAESLEWIVTLNHVQLVGEKAGEERNVTLCGNKQQCWAGCVDGAVDKAVVLSSINMQEARSLVEHQLQNTG